MKSLHAALVPRCGAPIGAPVSLSTPSPDRRALPRSVPPMPNAVRLLEDVPPHELPEDVVALAEDAAGCAVALYVVDIGGAMLRRVTGATDWPLEVPVPQAIGPELPRGRMSDVQRAVSDGLGGAVAVPLWSHGRAVAVLVAERDPDDALEPLVRQSAAALELADRYTDVLHAVRRRRPTTPAAEIQENLLPPRVAVVDGAEIAGGVVPAYEVGGDWFDYAANPDGVWLAVADASGKGVPAAGMATIALGALRAARRSGADLEGAALMVDEAVRQVPVDTPFLTAVLAVWHPEDRMVRWLRFGHPYPYRATAAGRVEELGVRRGSPPLGVVVHERLEVEQTVLAPGDRFVIVSDGVIERRTPSGGFFGSAGVLESLRRTSAAAETASELSHAVVDASPLPPRDDATVLVLRAVD